MHLFVGSLGDHKFGHELGRLGAVRLGAERRQLRLETCKPGLAVGVLSCQQTKARLFIQDRLEKLRASCSVAAWPIPNLGHVGPIALSPSHRAGSKPLRSCPGARPRRWQAVDGRVPLHHAVTLKTNTGRGLSSSYEIVTESNVAVRWVPVPFSSRTAKYTGAWIEVAPSRDGVPICLA